MGAKEQSISIVAAEGDAALEGRVCRIGESLAIIAPPHPMMGGSLDNPVVEALVKGFTAEGVSTLRFNFRGVGNSDGVPSGAMNEAVADYQRAVSWAREHRFRDLLLCGYSFGSVAALQTHLAGVACFGIAAVAPPTDMLSAERLSELDCLFTVLSGDRDTLVSTQKLDALMNLVAWGSAATVPGADHLFGAHLGAVTAFAKRVGADFLAGADFDDEDE